MVSLFFSKLDETTDKSRLKFVLPQHEYFHQYMVLADAESEITRENSRGLPGGSFLLATILNRKDARMKKGKEAIEAFKDFFELKSDAMFCTFFLQKFKLDENIDNTPNNLKNSPEKMLRYLHKLVAEA